MKTNEQLEETKVVRLHGDRHGNAGKFEGPCSSVRVENAVSLFIGFHVDLLTCACLRGVSSINLIPVRRARRALIAHVATISVTDFSCNEPK